MKAAVPDVIYNISLMCVVDIAVTLGTIFFMAILLKILIKTNVIKSRFTMEDIDVLVDKKVALDAKIKWGFFLYSLIGFRIGSAKLLAGR